MSIEIYVKQVMIESQKRELWRRDVQNTPIGIIGGSGLYQIDALEQRREHSIETPYGQPSDALVTGEIAGVPVVFLARHGRQHHLIPSEIPFRANIYAMKKLGVRHLLSFSAVGSLTEELAPLDMVLPDQFIDMTRQRKNTFFGEGAVAHISMADPTCKALAEHFAQSAITIAESKNFKLKTQGTYVCIEGPQFSTRAESHWFRSMGAQVIGMTNMPEARLAKEAQIAYISLGMITDYDCWHPKEKHVTADYAIKNLMQNSLHAQEILLHFLRDLKAPLPESEAHNALKAGLVTPLQSMSEDWQARIRVLIN